MIQDQEKPEIRIIDLRGINEFKTITFSGYKLSDVKKCLYNDILQLKLESASNWCVELICSGHIHDVWNIFVLFISKHILLANPKIPIYVNEKYNVYCILAKEEEELGILEIRNNMKVRELIVEVCAVILFSPRKQSMELMKIDKQDDFNIYNMSTKCYAPNTTYAQPIFRKEDPHELWIAINEFAYHIHESEIHKPDIMKALHWVEWVLEFNIICKKNKTKCVCEPRNNYLVDMRYQTDIIWLLWDTLILYANKKTNKIIARIIQSLNGLFCVNYSEIVAKKRKYIIYHALSVFTEPIDLSVRIIDQININYCNVAIDKIHELYKDKKENEHGHMKYLYNANIL